MEPSASEGYSPEGTSRTERPSVKTQVHIERGSRSAATYRYLSLLSCSCYNGVVSENITVVLIDDDDDLRGVVRGLIAAAPDIELVGDAGLGVEGIEETIYTEPDVIVLDYMMPGMSGDIVADAVKKNSPGTKILVFTAVLETAPDWADAFLTKLQIADLVDEIRALALSDRSGSSSTS